MTEADSFSMHCGDKVSHDNANITWKPTAADHARAKKNHYQTLERLNERGGMTWCEMAAILEDRDYRRMDLGAAKRLVNQILIARGED